MAGRKVAKKQAGKQPRALSRDRDQIQDPKLAAKVKQACDVARAAAVLVQFAARHASANEFGHLASGLPAVLGPAAAMCDECVDSHFSIYTLPAMLRSLENLTYAASEGLEEEERPKVILALAAAVRSLADGTELVHLGTAGTLADQSRWPDMLSQRMRQAAGRFQVRK